MSQRFDNPDLEDEVPLDLPEVIDLDEIVVNKRKFKLGGKVYQLEDRRDMSFVETEQVQRLLVEYRKMRAEEGRGPFGKLDAEQEARMQGIQEDLLSQITDGALTSAVLDALDPEARDRQVNAVVNLFFADWNRRAISLEELLGPSSTTTPSANTPGSSGTTPKSKPDSSSASEAETSQRGGASASPA